MATQKDTGGSVGTTTTKTGTGTSSTSSTGTTTSKNVNYNDTKGVTPSGLNVGDTVTTNGGTYTINKVNADGSYESTLTDPDKKSNYYPSSTSGNGDWIGNGIPDVQGEVETVEKVSGVDTSELKGYLDSWLSAAQQQAQNSADYATNQSVQELQRAQEDAAEQYQTQRNQIDADEARAKDNSALYAEARGDKGGIGQAQYDAIQAAAATNRQSVNSAQVQLSTDTARQIADLRAQGEYEKADKLLELSQTYLSQLMSLEQWGIETNISVDEFNAQLAEWQQEFALSEASITGTYNGQQTLASKQYDQENLISTGQTLLAAGIVPSSEQISAMGMTTSQAQQLASYYKTLNAASVSSGGSAGSGSGSGTTSTEYSSPDYTALFTAASKYDDVNQAKNFIASNYEDYGFTSSTGLGAAYVTWLNDEAKNAYMDSTTFSNFITNLKATLSGGNAEKVNQLVDARWTNLTDNQKTSVKNLLDQYDLDYDGTYYNANGEKGLTDTQFNAFQNSMASALQNIGSKVSNGNGGTKTVTKATAINLWLDKRDLLSTEQYEKILKLAAKYNVTLQ